MGWSVTQGRGWRVFADRLTWLWIFGRRPPAMSTDNPLLFRSDDSVWSYYDRNAARFKLIYRSRNDFIIFLDHDLTVWWTSEEDFDKQYDQKITAVPELSVLANQFWVRFNILAERPIKDLSPEVIEAFRSYIANALARLYEAFDPKSALAMLVEAENYLVDRSKEQARKWYVGSSTQLAILWPIIILLMWIGHRVKSFDLEPLVGPTVFWILIGSACGAVGAWLSVLQRVGNVPLNVQSGRENHRFEGRCRIIVGMISGGIVGLGVWSHLLAGTVKGDIEVKWMLAVLCVFAGVSERFVNSFLEQTGQGSGKGA